jgi:transmembrane sensor
MWWNKNQSSDEINQDVYDVFLRMNSGETTESDQKYFEDWKEKNPELLVKYQEMDDLWNELGIYATDTPADDDHEYRGKDKPGPTRYLRHPGLAIAASIILVVSIFSGLHFFPGENVLHYQTERGERLVVSLEDGSNIHLNSLTDVHVTFDEHKRIIKLNKGEALFDVAHDENRKFIVQTIHGSIQAVGTEFNISVISDDIEVTIIEGTVLVKSNVNDLVPAIEEIATVGEQILIDSRGIIESKIMEDAGQVIAWTRGKLVFSGEPLHQALEKINLHSKHNILVKDPRLRDLPLFGVFNTGDTLGFISAIQEAFPVQPLEVSGNATLLTYRTDG